MLSFSSRRRRGKKVVAAAAAVLLLPLPLAEFAAELCRQETSQERQPSTLHALYA